MWLIAFWTNKTLQCQNTSHSLLRTVEALGERSAQFLQASGDFVVRKKNIINSLYRAIQLYWKKILEVANNMYVGFNFESNANIFKL